MSTFTFFPLLPVEIRLQIWEHTIEQDPIKDKLLLPRSPISCLSVCHDSRAVYLRTYTPCFQPLMHSLVKYPISLYANLELDTLYLECEIDDCGIIRRPLQDWLTPQAMGGGLTRVAVEDDLWRDMDPDEGMGRSGDEGPDLRWNLRELEGVQVLDMVFTSTDPMDEESEEGKEGDLDDRRLVECESSCLQDDLVMDDMYGVLEESGWWQLVVGKVRLVYV